MKNLFSDFVHGLLGCGGPETDVELDGGKYVETVKKPPVHDFSGNVTVPAGCALTLAEGATVNDEAGALGNDEYINSLIDAKIGVIESGTY